MAVRIRMKKTGNKNNGSFRIVVLPKASGRDSRTIEELGYYDPRRSDETVNVERYDYWVSVGALPTPTVMAIVKRARDGKSKTLADHKVRMAEIEAAKPTKVRARKAAPVAENAEEAQEQAPAEEAQA